MRTEIIVSPDINEPNQEVYQKVSPFVFSDSRNQTFYLNRVVMNFPNLRLVRFE